jgi:uncharacterized protein (DUF1330 family)
MEERRVTTQADLDRAIENGVYPMICGNAYFEVRDSSQVTACDSSRVKAYGSSQVTACDSSRVKAYGSSQVTACDSSRVTAYGSSQVKVRDSSRVTAYGSSQVTAYNSSQVKAYGSSQVKVRDSSRVTAYNSSQVKAYGSSRVTATKFVAITRHGDQCNVVGGVLIAIPKIATAKEWCEFYDVEVVEGVAVLFKAVGDDYHSPKRGNYTPGTVPVADDWDGGKKECGGGLHFSPRPFMAFAFHPSATKYVACPVNLEDIAVHPDGHFPEKVKARGCCAPCWECDIDGNKMESA